VIDYVWQGAKALSVGSKGAHLLMADAGRKTIMDGAKIADLPQIPEAILCQFNDRRYLLFGDNDEIYSTSTSLKEAANTGGFPLRTPQWMLHEASDTLDEDDDTESTSTSFREEASMGDFPLPVPDPDLDWMLHDPDLARMLHEPTDRLSEDDDAQSTSTSTTDCQADNDTQSTSTSTTDCQADNDTSDWDMTPDSDEDGAPQWRGVHAQDDEQVTLRREEMEKASLTNQMGCQPV
jgi:hypothetical protein